MISTVPELEEYCKRLLEFYNESYMTIFLVEEPFCKYHLKEVLLGEKQNANLRAFNVSAEDNIAKAVIKLLENSTISELSTKLKNLNEQIKLYKVSHC